MNTDSLEWAALTLEHYAGVFEARALKYAQSEQFEAAAGQRTQAKAHAEGAEAIRAAVKLLKPKRKGPIGLAVNL